MLRAPPILISTPPLFAELNCFCVFGFHLLTTPHFSFAFFFHFQFFLITPLLFMFTPFMSLLIAPVFLNSHTYFHIFTYCTLLCFVLTPSMLFYYYSFSNFYFCLHFRTHVIFIFIFYFYFYFYFFIYFNI